MKMLFYLEVHLYMNMNLQKMLKRLRELVRGSITFLLKNVQKKELLFLIHRRSI